MHQVHPTVLLIITLASFETREKPIPGMVAPYPRQGEPPFKLFRGWSSGGHADQECLSTADNLPERQTKFRYCRS